jgi:hypothetical protein
MPASAAANSAAGSVAVLECLTDHAEDRLTDQPAIPAVVGIEPTRADEAIDDAPVVADRGDRFAVPLALPMSSLPRPMQCRFVARWALEHGSPRLTPSRVWWPGAVAGRS